VIRESRATEVARWAGVRRRPRARLPCVGRAGRSAARPRRL